MKGLRSTRICHVLRDKKKKEAAVRLGSYSYVYGVTTKVMFRNTPSSLCMINNDTTDAHIQNRSWNWHEKCLRIEGVLSLPLMPDTRWLFVAGKLHLQERLPGSFFEGDLM